MVPLSQQVEGALADFRCQFSQFLVRKSLAEIIYPVVFNAVFPKQRRKIAAGRSGRFLVDGDFMHSF